MRTCWSDTDTQPQMHCGDDYKGKCSMQTYDGKDWKCTDNSVCGNMSSLVPIFATTPIPRMITAIPTSSPESERNVEKEYIFTSNYMMVTGCIVIVVLIMVIGILCCMIICKKRKYRKEIKIGDIERIEGKPDTIATTQVDDKGFVPQYRVFKEENEVGEYSVTEN